jgi:FHS family L-fucose permease-like MFS transporter
MSQVKTNYSALLTLITVFFFWGFIAAGNSIFIPFCKHYFKLDQFQSQLIDFAFYFAYYIGALSLFVIGTQRGVDPVGKWGYKKSIIYGLMFSALGAGAMIISVYFNVFTGMLFGLFIVALGFSLQQTSANPFMISLGEERTGSNRISLGGGINSLGTTIGPLVVALVLFGSANVSDEQIQHLSLDKVIVLYICVGLLFVAIAALFSFSKKLPSGKNESKMENANKALRSLLIITGLLVACFAPVFNSYRGESSEQIKEKGEQIKHLESLVSNSKTIAVLEKEIERLKVPMENERMFWLSMGLIVIVGGLLISLQRAKKNANGWGAMQYPQLILGMLAIFIYVGVEVAIGSNLGELLKKESIGSFTSSEITPFIALYWGSLMIGRWASAVHAFELKEKIKNLLTVIVPLIAFGIVLLLTKLAGHSINQLYAYICCVIIQIIGFFVGKNKPAKTLFIFSFLGVIATIIGVMSSGIVAIYAFLSVGLFCSIMWPCIFSLALGGLGKYQSQGSAFLIMMILGGAIIPPLQGKLSDIVGIQSSFLVGTVCFVYLGFFSLVVKQILSKQAVIME